VKTFTDKETRGSVNCDKLKEVCDIQLIHERTTKTEEY
jgi:hypothetical protein